MFTTVSKVREVSGFVGNSNVSNSFISSQIIRAEAFINSYISDAYSIPVGKYYTQTIVFTGTGSGSATMTITIDGADYDVAITNSMTASEAADAFRNAASGNSSFITDGVGSGATVSLFSCEAGDTDDVTITSTDPQTVAGVTSTGGTVIEIAPPLLEAAATEIAAAYLLITEYGPESQDTDKDGFKRLALWQETLEKIQSKTEKIFDFCGTELARSSTKTLSFHPDDASAADETDSTDNKFKINKVF